MKLADALNSFYVLKIYGGCWQRTAEIRDLIQYLKRTCFLYRETYANESMEDYAFLVKPEFLDFVKKEAW